MLESIISSGYHESLPDYLKNRIKPTNIVAILLMLVVAVPFIILTPIYFPPILIFIPLSGSINCIGVIIANRLGGIRHSRYFLSLLPVTQGAAYNLFLCGPGDDPIPSVYLISLAFSLVPFVTFDMKEKGALVFTSLYSILLITSFPITRHWVTLEAETGVIRGGWLGTVTIFLGIITAFACVFGLMLINKQSERETNEARIKSEDRNKSLLAQQEENVQKTKELEAAQAEEKKRQWAAEGIAQVSEIVHKADKNVNIFHSLIAFTVKYTRANQGGLFVVNRNDNDNPTIALAACYAYERRKYIERTIDPGEGLVGQAFLEKEHLYFTEIPSNYVNITSGLGKATPSALLIVPMKVNETVEGILEIASFQTFEEYEITFLQKLGEVIASFIQNERVMQQTNKLLSQAQEQSEEMRSQEEEMRQNMEELQATQEEMHRKEKEYLGRIEELENQLNSLVD